MTMMTPTALNDPDTDPDGQHDPVDPGDPDDPDKPDKYNKNNLKKGFIGEIPKGGRDTLKGIMTDCIATKKFF